MILCSPPMAPFSFATQEDVPRNVLQVTVGMLKDVYDCAGPSSQVILKTGSGPSTRRRARAALPLRQTFTLLFFKFAEDARTSSWNEFG